MNKQNDGSGCGWACAVRQRPCLSRQLFALVFWQAARGAEPGRQFDVRQLTRVGRVERDGVRH